ncbi:helix-turn-helix domain-containing protein [Kribbella kalugense]|uniref:Helix-turn-helix protein n=1 Tax=Kribbella kalugense TaxID=2512221 RepID=A0A4R7ZXL7_9ACTN|nr:helix-turn-helix transcriptional regulator [Kribbella kalugense]TDW21901.1 helix-turn-helix protein [Kribbella kalugense]
MSNPANWRTLGAFLRARREALSPEDAGLPPGAGQRRVKGLRRAEVAQLASISIEYYTRLEQGRVRASAAVLDTLIRALRLDEDAQRYVYELADRTDDQPQPTRLRGTAQPAMRRLLDRLEGTPAIVLGRCLEILAWNEAAVALYLDFGALPVNERNYLRLMFLHPGFRALHREWEYDARAALGTVRLESAKNPGDAVLTQLVGELSMKDDDFRVWWAQQQLSGRYEGIKRYQHPLVGELNLDVDTWNSPDGSGQRLMMLSAEPASSSGDALRILTSWHETEHPSHLAKPPPNH